MIQNPFGLTTNTYLPANAYASLPHQNFSNQHPQQQLYPAPSHGYHSHPFQQPMFHGQQFPMAHQQPHNPTQYYMNPNPSVAPGGYQPPPQMAQYQTNLALAQQLPRTATDPTASTPTPPGMFTRNLIGSLGVSAFKLTDPDNAVGIWFILQDLSVRTEGNFRYLSPPSLPPSLLPSLVHMLKHLSSSQTENEFRQRRLPALLLQQPRRQLRLRPRPRILFLTRFPSLLGQKIPGRHREHAFEQVLRDAGDQDPDPEGRPEGEREER